MRNPHAGPPVGLPSREGTISPAMLHEYYRHDPAAYHLWLNQAARLQQEQHLVPDSQHPSAHPNMRLLPENEDYLRHLRSLELDPKFKPEHVSAPERGIPHPERAMLMGERGIPISERALPLGERGLPLGDRSIPLPERAMPLGERGIPLGERGLSTNERGPPRGDHFPFSTAAYIEHIRRLHSRLTPPSGKPVTIDLCED